MRIKVLFDNNVRPLVEDCNEIANSPSEEIACRKEID